MGAGETGGWGSGVESGGGVERHSNPGWDPWPLSARWGDAQRLRGSLSSGPLLLAARRPSLWLYEAPWVPSPRHLGPAPPRPAPSWLIQREFAFGED